MRPPVRIGTEMSKIRLTAGSKATVVRVLRWQARRFACAQDEARDRCLERRTVLTKQTIMAFHPALTRLEDAETLVLVDRAGQDGGLLANDAFTDDFCVHTFAERIVDQPAAGQELRRQFANVFDADEVSEDVMAL